jgi:hypothetical protein
MLFLFTREVSLFLLFTKVGGEGLFHAVATSTLNSMFKMTNSHVNFSRSVYSIFVVLCVP